MKQQRYIIDIRDKIELPRALDYCRWVALQGKISNFGKQHCYHTVFDDGIKVSCFKRGKSERFMVYKK